MEFYFSHAYQWAEYLQSYVKFMKKPYIPYQLSFFIFYKNLTFKYVSANAV